jgi:Ca-activated chloride channel family protein
MTILAWPWALALLPLPLLAHWLLPRARPLGGRALRLPARVPLAELAAGGRARRLPWQLLLAVAAWCLLVLAAARPQQLGEAAALPMSGRDLMLAVDVSGSMEQPDFELAGQPATRLAVVKQVARAFIDRRVQDRIGLILFASQPYVQTPLTYDRAAVAAMLDDAVVGVAGRDTAIGDAIGLAVKRLQEQPQENRVLVLLTDGDNTVGRLAPLQAAGLAARAGVRIYSIGLGGTRGEAAAGGYRLQQAADDLNPILLRGIADATGGRYFSAGDARELEAVYRTLDSLEPNVRQLATYRPARELYPLPAAAALCLSLLLALVHLRGGGAGRSVEGGPAERYTSVHPEDGADVI